MKSPGWDGCPFSLSGETALITGGGTGLGFAIASAMAKAGASVVLTGRRRDVLEEAARQIGSKATPHQLDLNASDSLEDAVAKISGQVGPVTILVNNAGIHLKKFAQDTTVTEFTDVWATHVRGAFAMTRAVLPSMLEHRRGSILFIASMVSFIGMPQVVAYAAAKSAYLGMVRSLATELSPNGLRVNAVAPGWIESPMLRQALNNDPPRRDRIIMRTPMARFGDSEDIGYAAVYLCSRAAKFVTGVILPVDGGASIGF